MKPVYLAAAAMLAAALAWRVTQSASGATAQSIGQSVGSAAVDALGGVVTGAVVGTGALFGVPETSMNECDRARAEGRTWDASFACPAGDFLKYVFG